MAGQDTAEIRVAPGGNISVAAVGSTAPTNATTALAAAFFDLGYTDTGGATLTPSIDTFEIDVWQSASPGRRGISKRSVEVKFTLVQLNYETLKFYMGGGTVTGSAGNYVVKPDVTGAFDERSMVVDWTDGASVSHRIYIPKGSITAVGDLQLVRNDAAKLPITFGAVAVDASTPIYTWFTSDTNFSAT